MIWFSKKKEVVKEDLVKLDEDGFPVVIYEHSQRLRERAMLINYPVGSDVIVKSNENEPYLRGTLVAYEPITKAQNLVPVVKLSLSGEVVYVLGKIRHYSKELCDALDKLTPIEQYNVLAEFHKITKE